MHLYPRLLLWAQATVLWFEQRGVGLHMFAVLCAAIALLVLLVVVSVALRPSKSDAQLDYEGMVYHCHPSRYDVRTCLDSFMRYVGEPRRPR